MRILCIAPCFVPEADSEAFCSGKIVAGLVNFGTGVIVISVDPYEPVKKKLDDSDLWKKLKNITVGISSNTSNNKLKSIIYGIEFNSLTYTRWLKAVLEKAHELNNKKSFDLIYSRSLPMIAHVAGYWVSRKLKKPWIANINDPWDWHLFPNNTGIQMSLASKINSNFWFKKTLRNANLITFPTKRLRDYHTRLSNIDYRSEIIPHVGYRAKHIGKDDIFRLTHTGKLGSNELTGRSAKGLLIGFKRMISELGISSKQVKLVLVGERDSTTESIIDDIGISNDFIEITGRVSYEQSLKYIATSTVCILIEGNFSEGIFLPSKLVDYLVGNKPILALSPKTGTIADLGSGKGIIRVDLEDSNSIKTELCQLYDLFKRGCLPAIPPKLIEEFGESRIVRRFLECVTNL
jgi:hypothetical protein